MGFFSDLLEAALPWSEAHAEAPKEEDVKVCLISLYYGWRDGIEEWVVSCYEGRVWGYLQRGATDVERLRLLRSGGGCGNFGAICVNKD